MGFEQLAELRDRLRAEKEPQKADIAKQPKRKSSSQAKPRIKDPAVEAIWPLQKHFPLAFPVNRPQRLHSGKAFSRMLSSIWSYSG